MNRKSFALALAIAITNMSTSMPVLAEVQSERPFTSDANITLHTSAVRPYTPRVALALAGGGVRGAAHIGVLKVFEREGIPVNCISGCSIGAIVGGLYAAGVPLSKIEDMMTSQSLQYAYAPKHMKRRLIGKAILRTLKLSNPKHAGFFSGKKLERFLTEALPENKRNIEDLDMPFTAVTTSLISGEEKDLRSGPLARAIVASSSIPPLLQPVEYDGDLLIDGACKQNLPCKAAKAFGADLLIGVTTNEKIVDMKPGDFKALMNLTNRMTSIALDGSDEVHYKHANFILTPDVTGITIFSESKEDVAKAVRAGELVAERAVPQIKEAMAKLAAERNLKPSAQVPLPVSTGPAFLN